MSPELDPMFSMGETDYDAMVDYIATDVMITAEANADSEIEFSLNGSVVTTTMGTGVSGTADLDEMVDLPVGDNEPGFEGQHLMATRIPTRILTR